MQTHYKSSTMHGHKRRCPNLTINVFMIFSVHSAVRKAQVAIMLCIHYHCTCSQYWPDVCSLIWIKRSPNNSHYDICYVHNLLFLLQTKMYQSGYHWDTSTVPCRFRACLPHDDLPSTVLVLFWESYKLLLTVNSFPMYSTVSITLST